MHVIDLLSPGRVSIQPCARSKKRVLEEMAELLCRDHSGLEPRRVFRSLVERERLGSTGFGHGVALPHGRMAGCETVAGALLRLREPVEFEAADGKPVDLIFGLIVPEACEERHLEMLAQLAQLFGEEENRQALREREDAAGVLDWLQRWQCDTA